MNSSADIDCDPDSDSDSEEFLVPRKAKSAARLLLPGYDVNLVG